MLAAAVSVLASGCTGNDLFANCDAGKTGLDVETEFLVRFDTDDFSKPEYNKLCNGVKGYLFDNRFSPYIGGTESVDIVVEHFSAFSCDFSREFAKLSRELLKKDAETGNRVRIYFHHLSGEDSKSVHAATVAAAEQGMDNFWLMHDHIYGNFGAELQFNELRSFASLELGLDMDAFDAATNGKIPEGAATYEFIEDESEIALDSCARGTPTVFVCGRLLKDWRDLEDAIDYYLH